MNNNKNWNQKLIVFFFHLKIFSLTHSTTSIFFPPHNNENVNVSFEIKQQKFSAEKFLSFNNFPVCVCVFKNEDKKSCYHIPLFGLIFFTMWFTSHVFLFVCVWVCIYMQFKSASGFSNLHKKISKFLVNVFFNFSLHSSFHKTCNYS